MKVEKCRVCKEPMPVDMEGGYHDNLGRFHVSCADELARKKPRLKLCPELVDGDHWTPVDTLDQALEAIKEWYEAQGQEEGEEFSVEVVMMSDIEVAELPDI